MGITTLATEILEQMDTYTEVSPSGTGLHLILKGRLPPGGRRSDEVEMYDTGRFFTVTCEPFGDPKPIRELQDALTSLHTRTFGSVDGHPQRLTSPLPTARRDDTNLLENIFSSQNGPDIKRLWEGDTGAYGNDASAADLALIAHLMFWTDYDPARADSLFRQSGLMRPKWDERHSSDGRSYGEMTLQKAAEGKRPGDGFKETRSAPKPNPKPKGRKLDLVFMHTVESEDVSFLWNPYIPLGKVTFLEGDPGLGKTFIALTLCSIVLSTGQKPNAEA